MAPVEDPQRPFAAAAVEPAGLGEVFLHLCGLRFQFRGFRLERLFIDSAAQIAVEQPILHVLQFRLPLGEHGRLPALLPFDILEGRGQRLAEPIVDFPRRQLQRGEVVDDGSFEVFGSPADGRMVRAWMVVRASIVDMFADVTVSEFTADTFARDGLAAIGTLE